jgi:hypothetical protein
MEQTTSRFQRVGLYVLRETWHAFRIACVTRNLSSSKEIERLMSEQLAAWQAQDKETDHA